MLLVVGRVCSTAQLAQCSTFWEGAKAFLCLPWNTSGSLSEAQRLSSFHGWHWADVTGTAAREDSTLP